MNYPAQGSIWMLDGPGGRFVTVTAVSEPRYVNGRLFPSEVAYFFNLRGEEKGAPMARTIALPTFLGMYAPMV